MSYLLLTFAIISEVFGSTMLKLSEGFSRKLPIVGVVVGFGTAFYLLSLSLVKLPLGFAYAVWSGLGTILIATVGVILFKEKINRKGLVGIGLLVAGILLLNLTE